MIRIASLFVLLVTLVPGAAWAAPLLAPGAAALAEVYLNVADVPANLKFWEAMGGAPTSWRGGREGVSYDGVGIVLEQRAAVEPAAGSSINHIGLYVPDVTAAAARWQGMGFKVESGHPGQAFVSTPGDLIRVELLERPDQRAAEAFHHVHLYVYPGPAGGIAEIQAWYARLLGATPGHRAQFENVLLPGGEITFAGSATPTAPSAGRAIDRIAFAVKGLKAFCSRVAAAGIALDTPYVRQPKRGLANCTLTDPWGTKLEFDEPL